MRLLYCFCVSCSVCTTILSKCSLHCTIVAFQIQVIFLYYKTQFNYVVCIFVGFYALLSSRNKKRKKLLVFFVEISPTSPSANTTTLYTSLSNPVFLPCSRSRLCLYQLAEQLGGANSTETIKVYGLPYSALFHDCENIQNWNLSLFAYQELQKSV